MVLCFHVGSYLSLHFTWRRPNRGCLLFVHRKVCQRLCQRPLSSIHAWMQHVWNVALVSEQRIITIHTTPLHGGKLIRHKSFIAPFIQMGSWAWYPTNKTLSFIELKLVMAPNPKCTTQERGEKVRGVWVCSLVPLCCVWLILVTLFSVVFWLSNQTLFIWHISYQAGTQCASQKEMGEGWRRVRG